MYRKHLTAVAAGLALLTFPALADPAYKSNDIVNFFDKQKLGNARTICVGTEAECGAEADPKAGSFDLLVTFDFNSDTLTDAAKQNLDEFAKAMSDSRLSAANFAIDGHTDATGSENYNLGLSERRAEAVVAYLSAKGIDAARLKPKGYGKTRPRVADPFDPGNRRVETRLFAD